MAGVPPVSVNRNPPPKDPKSEPEVKARSAPSASTTTSSAPYKSALSPDLERLKRGAPWREASREAPTRIQPDPWDFSVLPEKHSPAEKPTTWDHAMNVVGGTLQGVGGTILGLVTAETVVGGLVGGAIATDGFARAGHAIDDWRKDRSTDTWQSQGLQKVLNVSSKTANRMDSGMQIAMTAPVAALGTWNLIKNGSSLVKAAGVYSGALTFDATQAGVRSVATGRHIDPYSTQKMLEAGWSRKQVTGVFLANSLLTTAAVAAGGRQGPVRTEQSFKSFEPPPASSATAATASRTADFYSRKAPESVRQAAAQKLDGVTAKDLTHKSLVVVRESGTQNVHGVAVFEQNAKAGPWWLGRDELRNQMPKNSALVTHFGGDEAGVQQALGATVDAVKSFTKQENLRVTTSNPADAALMRDAKVSAHQVLRDAPSKLMAMPEDARPPGVTAALHKTDGSLKSPTQQLLSLKNIPLEERGKWPADTQRQTFTVPNEQPLSFLGSKSLGEWVHVMDRRSKLAQFNEWAHPSRRALDLWNSARRTLAERSTAQIFAPPPKLQTQTASAAPAPERTAHVYPRGVLSESQLDEHARTQVKAFESLGKLVAINRLDETQRFSAARMQAEKNVAVRVTERKPDGSTDLKGMAGIDFKFRQHPPRNYQQPHLQAFISERYPTHTAHIIGVAGNQGGGGQAVKAAVDYAFKKGARSVVYETQGQRPMQVFSQQGAKPDWAGFGPNAGEALLKQIDPNKPLRVQLLEETPPVVRDLVTRAALARSARPPGVSQAAHEEAVARDLQSKLPTTTNHFDLIGKVPDGVLLVRYRHDNTTASMGRKAIWMAADATDYLGNKIVTPALSAANQVLRPAVEGLGTAAGATWRAVNPYGLPSTVQPGPVREAIQDTLYAADNVRNELFTTGRGALVLAAGPQIATGNYRIYYNDDRALYPFNGKPGVSKSVALYLPATGTTVSAWYTPMNFRGPYPLDQSGLMPLINKGPAITHPTGPHGAGFLDAARFSFGELNVGIRYGGENNTVNAQSVASIRLLPWNGNVVGKLAVEEGGPTSLSVVHSITALMPAVSSTFYIQRAGGVVRSIEATLAGNAQIPGVDKLTQARSVRSGSHWTGPARSITTGTGWFLTPSPSYGRPDFADDFRKR